MKSSMKLSQMKLVSSERIDRSRDVLTLRRQKLSSKLRQQLEAAQAELSGSAYTVSRTRRVKDKATGAISFATVQRSIPKLYFVDARGKWYFGLRYGSKRLVIADGKDTVEVGEKQDLLPVIETLIEAIDQGVLDQQLRDIGKGGQSARRKDGKAASRV
jgi:hypothetical protein